MDEFLKTPLWEWHAAHGAKMASFAGWDMPIQYAGIIQEHMHTRSAASVFDICHMGQFKISGPGAAQALELAVTHNLATLASGKCRYGFLLNPAGGVIDDLIVYRLSQDEFMAVVNAARVETDFAVFSERLAKPGLSLENMSDRMGKIDLQGPASLEVIENVLAADFRDLGYFAFRQTEFAAQRILVSRTGYTGELGYELYLPKSAVQDLWEALLGQPQVSPAGLGARDTLRLEAGLSLYGHELDEEHTPAESNLAALLTSSALYVGHEHARDVTRQRLLPLILEGRRAARNGDLVLDPKTGAAVGRITSGSFAPSLGCAVAFAFIDAGRANETEFEILAGKNILPARLSPLPFHTKGTARKKL